MANDTIWSDKMFFIQFQLPFDVVISVSDLVVGFSVVDAVVVVEVVEVVVVEVVDAEEL